MRSLPGRALALAAGLVALSASAGAGAAQSPESGRDDELRRRCRKTLLRATRFLVEEVSTRGGYLWRYLPDLSRRWGEMEAYDTQIAVQPPGTPTMGQVFLEAYQATGDETFYDAAAWAARALVAGQHESGGWHYFIDFAGETSRRRWYDTIGRNGWRLEEQQTQRANATFDDEVTAEAARFLLRIYLEKRDPFFKAPVDRALGFILESQYPNGGWPQRYPPQHRPPDSKGSAADYTSFVTFNDDVVSENIRLLVDVYLAFGDPRVLEPIRRGMDVYLLTQQPAPQAGWAEQYTLDLKPAGARTYEPLALSPPQTAEHIRLLLRFYHLTGERKYLARIAEALDWLERCRLPQALTDGDRFTHPTLVEIGTDRPLFVHRVGSNVVNGRYFVDHDPRAPIVHCAGGGRTRIDVSALRRAYEETASLPPEEATRDSPLVRERNPSRASWNPGGWTDGGAGGSWRPEDAEVRRVIAALDERGRWLTRHEWTSHPYGGDGRPGPPTDAFATSFVGDQTDTSPFRDPSEQQYISMDVYARNMRLLIRALETTAHASRRGDSAVARLAAQPRRLIVLTDIEADPDDTQSLIRLLLYSNVIEIQGLIATTSTHMKTSVHPESIRAVLGAYGQVHGNLLRHDRTYPRPEVLESLVKRGLAEYGMKAVGAGKDSEGSEWIIQALESDDGRPLWIAVWGGPNTLAQALFKLRATRPAAEVARLVSKLRVYTISDQDDSGPWIRKSFPALFYIVSPGGYGAATWTGIHQVVDGIDNTTISNSWLADHIQQGHGPLGAAYPDVAYGMEGDTPSWLALVPNGLGDPDHPDWGGWGGRYELYRPELSALDPKGFTGGVPVEPETRPIWTNAVDEHSPPVAGGHGRATRPGDKPFRDFRATLWRWRDDFQNDFAARVDWTVEPYGEANHPPVPALDHAAAIRVSSGETFTLEGRATDPDGDSLSFYWLQYPEAGSWRTPVKIQSAENLARVTVAAPKVEKAETIHFVLRVTDKGRPPLTRYARVVVTVTP